MIDLSLNLNVSSETDTNTIAWEAMIPSQVCAELVHLDDKEAMHSVPVLNE